MKKIIIFFVILSNLYANIFTDKEKARKIGDIVQISLPFYAIVTTIYNDDFVDGGKNFLISFVSTQASVEILKRVVREERPNKSNSLSFPSGHSAASFASASFIHKRYGLNQAIIPYILATYVGYSRVKARKHYTHDVIAGGLLAGMISYFLVDRKISIESVNKGAIITFNLNF